MPLTYILSCSDEEFYANRIIIHATPKPQFLEPKFGVHIGQKESIIIDELVTVKFRFDKRQSARVILRNYNYYYEDTATITASDKKVFNRFLYVLSISNKLAYENKGTFTTDRGTIPLDGSADAVADFKQRIARLNVIQ
ncbi:MAG: hypothetical protein OXC02_01330 [Rhodobacteraceae bacterium]|nr:hypothetical protein [Paracoccaceae bacterium]